MEDGSPGDFDRQPGADAPPAAYVRPTYVAWADLLRRVFALDILACPDCGGRLRLLATRVNLGRLQREQRSAPGQGISPIDGGKHGAHGRTGAGKLN